MKKVLIIEASPRQGFTKKTAELIRERLKPVAEIEIVHIYEEDINLCKGDCACLIAGSLKCPYHDDAAYKILNKMMAADGVIYVIPNYALQVPAGLKNLFDRLAFVFHRPRLFNKANMTIVVEGIYGGKSIIKYVDEVMGFWGMRIIKGTTLTGGVYPNKTPDQNLAAQNRQKLEKAVDNYARQLYKDQPKSPSLFRLVLFRAARTSMNFAPDVLPADKAYFTEKGWFKEPFYYSAPLNPIHHGIGALVDRMIRRTFRKKAA